MASEAAITAAPTGSRARKKTRRHRDRVRPAPLRSPRAMCRAVRLDTAEVRPTAVRDSSTEYTGMSNWYSPMTSAPTSRDRATR